MLYISVFAECLTYTNCKHWPTTFCTVLLEPFYPRLEIGLVGGASGQTRIMIPLPVTVTVLLKLAVTVWLVPQEIAVTVLLKLAITVIFSTDYKLVKNIAIWSCRLEQYC